MLIIISENTNILTTDLIFFTSEHFLKGNKLRADTTNAWPPCPFPNFVFEIYQGFCFL